MTMSPYPGQQRTAPVWQGSGRRVVEEISFELEGWATQATCRRGDPDRLFVKGAHQRSAAAICRPCHVRKHCLVTALDNWEEFGVWGGLAERQRPALLRKNALVDNWADHLTTGGELRGI